ncbi:unannotated protein [freshwater metagenome]|uniref:Unannotated protein n=1 Tax=freshwater metagenome TaxID=449393 RepID=A0A6J7L848_9ZZZZ
MVSAASASTAATRSLVLVFPDDPVIATTVQSGRRSSWARASRPRATIVSATTTEGTPMGCDTSATTAPDASASATWSCPSCVGPTRATKRSPGFTDLESVLTTDTRTAGSAW